jgi:hypothetical protein
LDIIGLLTKFPAEFWGFVKHNLRLWLGLLRDPVDVVEKYDLNSDKVLNYSLSFAAFIYVICLAIALPLEYHDGTAALPGAAEFVLDAITQLVGFVSICIALWVSGRVLGARTDFKVCLSAGFFMTAVWPILHLAEWVLRSDWVLSLPPVALLSVFGAVFIGATGFALYWAVPFVAHVHKFGRGRAIPATVLLALIVGVIWAAFVNERFPTLG